MFLDRYNRGSFSAGRTWLVQAAWYFLGYPVVRSHFIPFSRIKVFILRLFGARIGRGVTIKPGVRVKYPWRLSIGDNVWVGEDCWFDNLAHISIDSNSCVSQGSYLCTGDHDWSSPSFDLKTRAIIVASHAWVGAGVRIGPGTALATGSVITIGAAFSGKTQAWGIYQGTPAIKIKERQSTDKLTSQEILLVNQNFYPDQSATSQYLQDLAISLVEEGHQVTVLCSRYGYLNSNDTFQTQEKWRGITIERVGAIRPTKSGRLVRALSGILLSVSFAIKLLRLPRFDTVVTLTSPPLIAWTTLIFGKRPRDKFIYWVMDINPDQAVAAGVVRRGSLIQKILERAMRTVLRRCDSVITLDRFMKERLIGYGVEPSRVKAINLWGNNDRIYPVDDKHNKFREKYSLTDKFLIMYSGNMSLCHPLDLVLAAAEEMRSEGSLIFVFIGDGVGAPYLKDRVAKEKLSNVLFLPYQDSTELAHSLSAGNVHIISLAEQFTGMIHPSKFYGVLAAGRPLLFLGPKEAFISESIEGCEVGTRIDLENVEKLVTSIGEYKSLNSSESETIRNRVRNLSLKFERSAVLPELVKCITGSQGGSAPD